MSPPIRDGSGNDIGSIRLGDGSEIAEVRTGAGDVLFSAIPDSAIAQYDAQSDFTPSDDGNSVSSWNDELGNYNLSGGSPTVRESGINGYRSLEFDGGSDEFTASTNNFSQPNTIIIVSEPLFNVSTNDVWVQFGGIAGRNDVKWRGGGFSNQGSEMFAGNSLGNGTTDTTTQLTTTVFDGGSSIQRTDGTQTLSGNAGGDTLQDFIVGNDQFNKHWDGYIGEIIVYDARLSSSEINGEEQRLASKWGITL